MSKTTNKTAVQAMINYVESLIKNSKIFTTKTITKHFPKATAADVTTAVQAASKGKGYVTVTNDTAYIPSKMFASNGSKVPANKTIKVKSRQSTNGRSTVTNVPLSVKLVKDLNLSVRQYRYSVSGSTITIYRNSKNPSHNSFTVWRTNRACIPTADVGKEYTIVVK